MRVLVAVASRHGATAQIGDRLAGALQAAGLEVVSLAASDVENLEGFDAAVIGSGIYAGRWLGDARALVDRHEQRLMALPTWLFSSGPLGDPLFPAEPPEEPVKLAEHLGAREHRVFAGKLERAQLSRPERVIMKILKAPEGDYRDWDAIDAWAHVIVRELATVA